MQYFAMHASVRMLYQVFTSSSIYSYPQIFLHVPCWGSTRSATMETFHFWRHKQQHIICYVSKAGSFFLYSPPQRAETWNFQTKWFVQFPIQFVFMYVILRNSITKIFSTINLVNNSSHLSIVCWLPSWIADEFVHQYPAPQTCYASMNPLGIIPHIPLLGLSYIAKNNQEFHTHQLTRTVLF